MNEAGYYTGRQICNRHPLICELFGWTATELATLGRYDVVKARVTNTAVYLYESDLLELAKFIIHQRDKRNQEALNSTPAKKNGRTLGFSSCVSLAKSMPLDQAIHIIKSEITGIPTTAVIEGELVVMYVR